MAQMWVSASYFVSALLNARCSSSFCKTFHVSFNLYSTWTYISGVRIFKFRVRRILQVLDSLRSGSALITCTALAHAAQACSCVVCFSAGHILPEVRKFICAMKLWSADRSRPQKKTADPSPRPTATSVRRTLAYIGLVSSDGRCLFFKSTICRYLWVKISVIAIISAIICLLFLPRGDATVSACLSVCNV